MDASIILQGRQPNVVNVLAQSDQAAQQRINFDQQNALSATLRQNGPGILAGEQGALNALAQFDPQAALGVQSTRLGMDQTRQQMAILGDREKREVQQYAAQIGAAKAAEEAAKIEASIKRALMAPTPEAFDAMMIQNGSPELVGQFDSREQLASQYMSVAEILKMNAPADVPAGFEGLQLRAQAAGLTPGTPEYQNFMMTEGKQSNGMAITTNADGTMTFAQGPGVVGKPLTEGQSKDTVYVTRAEGALSILDPIAGNLANLGMRAAEYDPTGVIRGRVQSDDFQVAKTAGDEFLQAILRKDTGAAITAGEQALYGTTYLPQPGDGEAQLEYKKSARRRAVEAIKAGLPPSAIIAQEKALAASGSSTLPPVDGATRDPAAPPQGALDVLMQNNTPEYRALFDEVFGPGAAAKALGGN